MEIELIIAPTQVRIYEIEVEWKVFCFSLVVAVLFISDAIKGRSRRLCQSELYASKMYSQQMKWFFH